MPIGLVEIIQVLVELIKAKDTAEQDARGALRERDQLIARLEKVEKELAEARLHFPQEGTDG